MHEFSICERVVDAVIASYTAARPAAGPLLRAHLVAGGMHQIVPAYMATAYEVLTRDTPAEGSELVLRVTPVTGRCKACTWEGGIEPPVFQCGACGHFGVDVTSGNELFLERLEVRDDGDT